VSVETEIKEFNVLVLNYLKDIFSTALLISKIKKTGHHLGAKKLGHLLSAHKPLPKLHRFHKINHLSAYTNQTLRQTSANQQPIRTIKVLRTN